MKNTAAAAPSTRTPTFAISRTVQLICFLTNGGMPDATPTRSAQRQATLILTRRGGLHDKRAI